MILQSFIARVQLADVTTDMIIGTLRMKLRHDVIFLYHSRMYGLFQTAFYFGYMAMFSLALGLMCGTVGYMGSSAFVRKIYSTVKID